MIVIIRPATRPMIEVVKAGMMSPMISLMSIDVEPTFFNTSPSMDSIEGVFCSPCIEEQIAINVNNSPKDVHMPGKLLSNC